MSCRCSLPPAAMNRSVFCQKVEAAGKTAADANHQYGSLIRHLHIGASLEAPLPRRLARTSWASPARCVNVRWSLVQASASRRELIARAEIVIEGELLPGVRREEDQHTATPRDAGISATAGGANPPAAGKSKSKQ